jgi:hypothetical protein
MEEFVNEFARRSPRAVPLEAMLSPRWLSNTRRMGTGREGARARRSGRRLRADAGGKRRYSARNATVGSMLSARRVGTTQPSMQTPSMTIP